MLVVDFLGLRIAGDSHHLFYLLFGERLADFHYRLLEVRARDVSMILRIEKLEGFEEILGIGGLEP